MKFANFFLRQLCLATCLLLFVNDASCQVDYHLSYGKEGITGGIGLITLGIGVYNQKKVLPLQIGEIKTYDPMEVNSFDRIATKLSSPFLKKTSDLVAGSSFFFHLPLYLNADVRKNFKTIEVLWAETQLFANGLLYFTKFSVLRPRPFVYNSSYDLESKLTTRARLSFFSGHTTLTSVNCFFTAKVFNDFFPNSRYKKFIWAGAITIPAVEAYLRVRSGQHYPTDVITGYAVGALTGYFIPYFAKKIHKQHIQAIPNGVSLSF